ncbi:MAG: hypothetical protein KME26_20500 [Oscillatoria princeps RMCB-10]|nr:hypothetical protein [Oscillatoria princeps RMCB-10]
MLFQEQRTLLMNCAELLDRVEQAEHRSILKQHWQIVGGEWELIKGTYSC